MFSTGLTIASSLSWNFHNYLIGWSLLSSPRARLPAVTATVNRIDWRLVNISLLPSLLIIISLSCWSTEFQITLETVWRLYLSALWSWMWCEGGWRDQCIPDIGVFCLTLIYPTQRRSCVWRLIQSQNLHLNVLSFIAMIVIHLNCCFWDISI